MYYVCFQLDQFNVQYFCVKHGPLTDSKVVTNMETRYPEQMAQLFLGWPSTALCVPSHPLIYHVYLYSINAFVFCFLRVMYKLLHNTCAMYIITQTCTLLIAHIKVEGTFSIHAPEAKQVHQSIYCTWLGNPTCYILLPPTYVHVVISIGFKIETT